MTHRYHKQSLIRKLAAKVLANPDATPKQILAAMRMVQQLPDSKVSKGDKTAPEKKSELDQLLRESRKNTVGHA